MGRLLLLLLFLVLMTLSVLSGGCHIVFEFILVCGTDLWSSFS